MSVGLGGSGWSLDIGVASVYEKGAGELLLKAEEGGARMVVMKKLMDWVLNQGIRR